MERGGVGRLLVVGVEEWAEPLYGDDQLVFPAPLLALLDSQLYLDRPHRTTRVRKHGSNSGELPGVVTKLGFILEQTHGIRFHIWVE